MIGGKYFFNTKTTKDKMSKQKKSNASDPLESELKQELQKLDAQRKLREDQQTDLVFGCILKSMTSKKSLFDHLQQKTPKGWQKTMWLTVVADMQAAANGMLWCQNFSSRPHAEQDIFVYVGTHYVMVSPAAWKVFVRHCAERCELPDEMLMDADYMEKVGKNAAYAIFDDLHSHIPNEEVWLNMPSGTMVVKADGTTLFREHRRDDMFLYCLSYNFDIKAQCPNFRKYIDRVVPEAEAQIVIKEYICYILMKSHRFEKILWIFGSGANGKSTLLNVIILLIGPANISFIPLPDLTTNRVVRLGFEHRMLNMSMESGRDVEPNTLKTLVSGEPVVVERKYHDARQTTDYGKLLVASNNCPKAEDTYAFRRRMILMPFTQTITEAEMDNELIDKLRRELPGILAWALEAFPALVARRAFTESPMCRQALHDYMAQADSVKLFVSEMCQKSDTPVRGADLYYHYKDYCRFLQLEDKEGRNGFFKKLKAYRDKSATDNSKSPKMFYLKVTE